MKRFKIFGLSALLSSLLIGLMSNASWAALSADSSVDEAAQSAQYVSISVDRVALDTAGLAVASYPCVNCDQSTNPPLCN